jgi:peptidoglycan/LPS O-acetylase OafA/YrhL
MLSYFITVTAWLALIGIVSGLVLMMLKPISDQPPKLVAVQVIGAVGMILIAVGMLVRTDMSVYLPLSLVGSLLAILSVVLRIRDRSP